MKKISKKLYLASQYYSKHFEEETLKSICEKFGTERHSVSKHLYDYEKYKYFYNDEYYYITEEELEPVVYFLEHPTESLISVARRFKTKSDTIKRRLAVIGEDYHTRYSRNFTRNIFHDIDTEEKAYWLGFILADGYLNEDRGFLKIKLADKDRKHLEKFAIFMGDSIDYIKSEYGGAYEKNNLCAYIEFDSRELTQDLIAHNIRQNKSGKEQPILFEDANLTKAYIRGMIDGDGHIENGYFKYVGSLASCEYMKSFFSKWYDFNPDCRYIYEKGTIYSFEIRSKQVNDILKIIYDKDALIYLDRKFQIVQNF